MGRSKKDVQEINQSSNIKPLPWAGMGVKLRSEKEWQVKLEKKMVSATTKITMHTSLCLSISRLLDTNIFFTLLTNLTHHLHRDVAFITAARARAGHLFGFTLTGNVHSVSGAAILWLFLRKKRFFMENKNKKIFNAKVFVGNVWNFFFLISLNLNGHRWSIDPVLSKL